MRVFVREIVPLYQITFIFVAAELRTYFGQMIY